MYICKVHFNSSTCLVCFYRQNFCTSTWTWTHLEVNLQVPGMEAREGNGCVMKKSLWFDWEPLQIWCEFLPQTFGNPSVLTGQLEKSFPTKTSCRNPLDLTLEVEQAGWKFPLSDSHRQSVVDNFSGAPLAPKRKVQRCQRSTRFPGKWTFCGDFLHPKNQTWTLGKEFWAWILDGFSFSKSCSDQKQPKHVGF